MQFADKPLDAVKLSVSEISNGTGEEYDYESDPCSFLNYS
jgi:hypothetical protein